MAQRHFFAPSTIDGPYRRRSRLMKRAGSFLVLVLLLGLMSVLWSALWSLL